jgi:hypothetical protein
MLRVKDRTGTLICELPQATITSVEWELNKEGKLEFTVPKGQGAASLIKSAIHEAQVWWKGAPIWTGPIWQPKRQPLLTTFPAQGLLSYFRKRFVLNASLLYTSIEQTTIANNLVTAAQTGFSYMDFHIGTTANVGGSNHVRSRNYKREQHPCYYDLLQEFPGIRDGFDFEIVTDPSGNTRTFTTYYPNKQTIQTGIGLEYGRNVYDYEVNENAFDMMNRVYVTGGSSGGTKFENNYEDATSEAAYGQMQAVKSDGSQNDVNWLLDEAHRWVEIGKIPTISSKITAVEVQQALLDVIHVGDLVTVTINDYDTQVSGKQRVQHIKWTPPDGKLVFDFVPPVVLL